MTQNDGETTEPKDKERSKSFLRQGGRLVVNLSRDLNGAPSKFDMYQKIVFFLWRFNFSVYAPRI
jgi:hypothetical protein